MQSQRDMDLISALDLNPIKNKLMHQESGAGWSPARTAAIETEYRRFLYLMKAYPNEQTAPLADVDTFWHYHILDTLKYARDCQQAFGYFLHHDPQLGLDPVQGARVQQQAGARMRELYEATFGEAYGALTAAAVQTAWCGRASPQAGAAGADTAWCGRALPATQAGGVQTAWCGRASQAPLAADVQTAWCGRAAPAQDNTPAQTAWCGRAAPLPLAA